MIRVHCLNSALRCCTNSAFSGYRYSSNKESLPLIASDETHHIWSSFERAYPQSFKKVLSFHSPENVAAVESYDGTSYHIDTSGDAIYSSRFKRVFGFYQSRAAVCDTSNEWYHIDKKGKPIYANRYVWCGNYSRLPTNSSENNIKAQAPVRCSDDTYFLVDEQGKTRGGPFLYAGDPNSQGETVVWNLSGRCSVLKSDGTSLCINDKQNILDMQSPHKGILAVKDSKGWFYVNRYGEQIGSGRYLEVEPHYNGQARVRLLNGAWAVIDEGGKIIVELGQSKLETKESLVSLSQQWWESVALKMILESNVLNTIIVNNESRQHQYNNLSAKKIVLPPKFREILLNVANDLGLCRRSINDNNDDEKQTFSISTKGSLLISNSTNDNDTVAKCQYWLQDRYFNAWLSSPLSSKILSACSSDDENKKDTFRDIAGDESALSLSQRVLALYAQDWKGITNLLPINKLENQAVTIVDIAGGTGSLLKEIESNIKCRKLIDFICVERPEVVAVARHNHSHDGSKVQFVVGDLFDGPLPTTADLYLMSRVLHDWSDEKVLSILRRVHQYSPPEALLCVIDRHASPQNMHSLLSLHMYMLQRSFERTLEEWKILFNQSGWFIKECKPFNGHEIVILSKKQQYASNDIYPLLPGVVSDAAATSAAPRHSSVDDFYFKKSRLDSAEDDEMRHGPRKAIVPVAGLGTRMGLQSLATPKALLPILSRSKQQQGNNGVESFSSLQIQPALNILLHQLLASHTGIEQVCIVASSNQMQVLSRFLAAFEMTYQECNIATSVHYALSDMEPPRYSFLDNRIAVVVQQSALGFGDAILCGKDFVGDDKNFLVALGDHVFTPGCVDQLISSYTSLLKACNGSTSVIGLTGACLCGVDEIPLTGLLKCISSDICDSSNQNNNHALLVSDMEEKPSKFDHFETDHYTGKYLSQLGLDILPASIFTQLQQLKVQQQIEGGEVNLRQAMKQLLQENSNLYATLVDGTRLDIGTPATYWSTLQQSVNSYQYDCIQSNSKASSASEETTLSAKQRTTSDRDNLILNALSAWLQNVLPDTTSSLSSKFSTHVASSPGRVDLMGGFADYSGSSVLQHSTAMRCYALVTLTDQHQDLDMTTIQVSSVNDIVDAFAKGEESVRSDCKIVQPDSIFSKVISTDILFDSRGTLVSKSKLRERLTASETSIANSNAKQEKWPRYLVGIIHALMEFNSGIFPKFATGVRVVVVSDLPWNTGLASSAAVEMSTACVVGHALGLQESELVPSRLALLCQAVENQVVGANCGFMDQVAVGYAVDDDSSSSSLVGFRCQLPLPLQPTSTVWLPPGMSVVSVESGVIRSVADPPYKQVRVASIMGKHIINQILLQNSISNRSLQLNDKEAVTYLCNIPLSTYKHRFHDALPTSISGRRFVERYGLGKELNLSDINLDFMYQVQAATAHPIEEHFRVRHFESILSSIRHDPVHSMSFRSHQQQRDESSSIVSYELLGDLMQQSHISYTKCGLGTSQTDILAQLIREEGRPRLVNTWSRDCDSNVIGAKISGGGGGGALAVLLSTQGQNQQHCEAVWKRVKEKYYSQTGLVCKLHSGSSSKMRYHGALGISAGEKGLRK